MALSGTLSPVGPRVGLLRPQLLQPPRPSPQLHPILIRLNEQAQLPPHLSLHGGTTGSVFCTPSEQRVGK